MKPKRVNTNIPAPQLHVLRAVASGRVRWHWNDGFVIDNTDASGRRGVTLKANGSVGALEKRGLVATRLVEEGTERSIAITPDGRAVVDYWDAKERGKQ